MRASVVFVGAIAAALLACKSEQVLKAPGCSDPCCSGSSALVDCSENRNVTCTESGDPCTAQSFGCVGGVFFEKPQAFLPASCAADGGMDATTDDGPFFTGDDGPSATGDGGADAIDDTTDGGMLFACGDASCSPASQYCRHTVGGSPPGIDTQLCEPLDQGQSICAPDAPNGGCQCSDDAGGLYVRCDVP
jgi:hypothetical protein